MKPDLKSPLHNTYTQMPNVHMIYLENVVLHVGNDKGLKGDGEEREGTFPW